MVENFPIDWAIYFQVLIGLGLLYTTSRNPAPYYWSTVVVAGLGICLGPWMAVLILSFWIIAVIFRDVAGRDGWTDPITRGFFISELIAAYNCGVFYRHVYHSCINSNGDPFSLDVVGNTCVDRVEALIHVFFLVFLNECFILLCGWINLSVFLEIDANTAFKRSFAKNMKYSAIKSASFSGVFLFFSIVFKNIVAEYSS